MGDLISRQALYKKTAEWEAQALHMVEKTMNDEDLTEWRKWSTILTERSAFKFDIADAPSIDAVPVVRCKDCKYKCETEDGEWNPEDVVCSYWDTDGLEENDYCSYAERKEDG